MAVRKYEYATPKGGWLIRIFRNDNGFVFGEVVRNDNHVIGWQTESNFISWDHIPTHPKYITHVVKCLWQVFTGHIDIPDENLEKHLLYRVKQLTK